MADTVLDASAMVALIESEPGWETVAATTNRVVSSVNLAEATTALISKRGYSFVDAKAAVIELHADTIPFDESQAYETARLQPITRGRGLSLGDRACIALARARGSAAVTGDTIWGVDVDGVPVVQIR